ncbi:MAG: hypothetical protein IH600_11300, partial [Bacteroidetes bacterium]|nr:hypothetical protein [Bacteroidota bacterium]
MLLRRLSLLSLLLLLGWHASAQDQTPGFRDVMRFGVYGGPQFNFHSGTYEALDQNALCGVCDFENGDVMKFRFEALLEIPLTPSLMLSGRIGLQDFSGQFDRDNYYVGQVAQPTGPPADLIVDHTFDNALSYLVVTPGILYFPIEEELHLNLGLGFGFPMSKDYTLREEMVSPAGITFSDGTRDHVIRDEEIQNVNGFRLSLEIGAGYDIPLTRNLLLTPALGYSLPLTSVTDKGEWSASALAAGVGLLWAMDHFNFFAKEAASQLLKVRLPGDMPYATLFGGVFARYLNRYELIAMETVQAGTLLELIYSVEAKRGIDVQ